MSEMTSQQEKDGIVHGKEHRIFWKNITKNGMSLLEGIFIASSRKH